MLDIVRRADAGDLKCRIFLLKAIDRGDRRKLTAQRNAKKAKTDDLREFEAAKADEISPEPLAVAVEIELVNTVSPTVPPRATNVSAPRRPSPQRDSLLASAATLRRDPHTGNLLSPEGRELLPEEEERLLYPNWPHVSPHLGKVPFAGANAGDLAGPESPDAKSQAIDSSQEFGREKISRENPLPGPDRKGTLH
jgi:hypothetical protein